MGATKSAVESEAKQPDLSIVLPCYKAAALASRSVEQLLRFFAQTDLSAEIIVVDDGGGDFVSWPYESDDLVRLIKLPVNQGKGAAVRAGMLDARGRVRIFTDVDLPYDLELFLSIFDLVHKQPFHVVIGDRQLPGSSYATEIGWKRRIASSVFTTFVGRFVTGGFFDTQCGLKGFRGDVAAELFRLGRIKRFAFDVELVYLSLIHKLDIKRIPVQLRNNETSSVRVIRDSAQMGMDIFAIKWHRMKGYYRSQFLKELIHTEFESTRQAAIQAHSQVRRSEPERGITR